MSHAPLPALSARELTKAFAHTLAVDRVSIDFHPGEIHAVLGENGAGKSTLMHLLCGLYHPDTGKILLNGHPVSFASPRAALAAGIAMVHQHFMLVPSFSAVENLVLALPKHDRQRLDRQKRTQEAQTLATHYGLTIESFESPVSTLSVGTQQRIEILKALASSARILILDEPTAVLTPTEAEHLFAILQRLKREGYCIIVITHKIPEVFSHADRLSILRRGRFIMTRTIGEVSVQQIAALMVGEPSLTPLQGNSRNEIRNDSKRKASAPVLTLNQVSTHSERGRVALHDISFSVASGEIVGIAGVDGNGQAELAEVLLGLLPLRSGEFFVQGHVVHPATSAHLRARGVAVIPHDRRHEGLALALSIEENLLLNSHLLSTLAPGIPFSPARMRHFAEQQMQRFRIQAASPAQPVATLSGGNQQRVVIARELAQKPKILVAANPSRGLDITATAYVHRTLREYTDQGAGVLLISTDLDEVIALSDRVYVLYHGRLLGPSAFPLDRLTIGQMMTGTRTPC